MKVIGAAEGWYVVALHGDPRQELIRARYPVVGWTFDGNKGEPIIASDNVYRFGFAQEEGHIKKDALDEGFYWGAFHPKHHPENEQVLVEWENEYRAECASQECERQAMRDVNRRAHRAVTA